MRKKKVLGLMLSFTLAFGLALPATMAMPLESAVTVSDSNANATDSNVMATDRNVTSTDSNATETDSNATENVVEHIATCLEGCTGEGCECVCHMASLFDQIMVCENLDQVWTIMDNATEEEIKSLTDAQWDEVDILIGRLIDQKEEMELLVELDSIVESDVIYPTISFTNVAPFGNPVVGKAE